MKSVKELLARQENLVREVNRNAQKVTDLTASLEFEKSRTSKLNVQLELATRNVKLALDNQPTMSDPVFEDEDDCRPRPSFKVKSASPCFDDDDSDEDYP